MRNKNLFFFSMEPFWSLSFSPPFHVAAVLYSVMTFIRDPQAKHPAMLLFFSCLICFGNLFCLALLFPSRISVPSEIWSKAKSAQQGEGLKSFLEFVMPSVTSCIIFIAIALARSRLWIKPYLDSIYHSIMVRFYLLSLVHFSQYAQGFIIS